MRSVFSRFNHLHCTATSDNLRQLQISSLIYSKHKDNYFQNYVYEAICSAIIQMEAKMLGLWTCLNLKPHTHQRNSPVWSRLLYSETECHFNRVLTPFCNYIPGAAPSGRVFAPFGSENGYTLCPFWSGIDDFRGNYGSAWTYCIYRFNSVWVRKKEKYANRNGIEEFYVLRSNLSNDNIISA